LIALFELGECPGIACHHHKSYSPASLQYFARTYQVYRSSHRLSTEILQFLSETSFRAATAQNVKTSVRLDIESRSSKLLIP